MELTFFGLGTEALVSSFFCPQRYLWNTVANHVPVQDFWSLEVILWPQKTSGRDRMATTQTHEGTCHPMSISHGMQYRAVSACSHSPCCQCYPDLKEGVVSSFPSLVKYFLLLCMFTVPNLATLVYTYRHAKTLCLYAEEWLKKIVLIVMFLRLNWWVTYSTCNTNRAISYG